MDQLREGLLEVRATMHQLLRSAVVAVHDIALRNSDNGLAALWTQAQGAAAAGSLGPTPQQLAAPAPVSSSLQLFESELLQFYAANANKMREEGERARQRSRSDAGNGSARPAPRQPDARGAAPTRRGRRGRLADAAPDSGDEVDDLASGDDGDDGADWDGDMEGPDEEGEGEEGQEGSTPAATAGGDLVRRLPPSESAVPALATAPPSRRAEEQRTQAAPAAPQDLSRAQPRSLGRQVSPPTGAVAVAPAVGAVPAAPAQHRTAVLGSRPAKRARGAAVAAAPSPVASVGQQTPPTAAFAHAAMQPTLPARADSSSSLGLPRLPAVAADPMGGIFSFPALDAVQRDNLMDISADLDWLDRAIGGALDPEL